MAKLELARVLTRKDAARRARAVGAAAATATAAPTAATAGPGDHAARLLWQVLLGPFSANPALSPQQPAQRGPGGA